MKLQTNLKQRHQHPSHLVTVDTLVRPFSRVNAHVFVETGRLRKTLPTHRALEK